MRSNGYSLSGGQVITYAKEKERLQKGWQNELAELLAKVKGSSLR